MSVVNSKLGIAAVAAVAGALVGHLVTKTSTKAEESDAKEESRWPPAISRDPGILDPPSAEPAVRDGEITDRYTVLLTATCMFPELAQYKPHFDKLGLDLIVPEVPGQFLTEEEVLVYAGQFDACIIGDDTFNRRVLEAILPRCKVISKWGTGIDNIDLEAAKELKLPVMNCPNAFSVPVSESVVGSMLAFARSIPENDRLVKSGEWNKIPGTTIGESIVGIIGCGNIGKLVLRKCAVFGARILVNNRSRLDDSFLSRHGARQVSLEELLANSDFVAIVTNLNDSSRHLINKNNLQLMKPSAVIINFGRGPVIDEEALVNALLQKKIRGAALDVFETEPLPEDSKLRQLDNVILSPHNANQSTLMYQACHWKAIRNVLEVLKIPIK